MYILPEGELMIARLEHERLTKRARRLASLGVPEWRLWLRLPAWLPRVTTLWRRRAAVPPSHIMPHSARRHRTELPAVHQSMQNDTARRLRRARRHERTPHHRAVKRRQSADL